MHNKNSITNKVSIKNRTGDFFCLPIQNDKYATYPDLQKQLNEPTIF